MSVRRVFIQNRTAASLPFAQEGRSLVPAACVFLCFSYFAISPSVQMTTYSPVLLFHFDPFWIAAHCACVPVCRISVKLLQSIKALFPMLVTDDGIVTDVKPPQP